MSPARQEQDEEFKSAGVGNSGLIEQLGLSAKVMPIQTGTEHEEHPWWASDPAQSDSGDLAIETMRVQALLQAMHHEQVGALDNEVRSMLSEPVELSWEDALVRSAASAALRGAMVMVGALVGAPLAGTLAGTVFSNLSRSAIRAAISAVESAPDPGLGLADMFIAVQNMGMNEASIAASNALIAEARGLAACPDGPQQMALLGDAIEAQLASARVLQVDGAIEQWLVLLAWTASGTLQEGGGTDLSSSVSGLEIPGVLTLDVDIHSLGGRPILADASLPGTGEALKRHLDGELVGGLDIPWVCSSTVALGRESAPWPEGTGQLGHLRVGVNENSTVFDTMVDAPALLFLLARYRPDLPLESSVAERMRETLCGALLGEVGELSLPKGGLHA